MMSVRNSMKHIVLIMCSPPSMSSKIYIPVTTFRYNYTICSYGGKAVLYDPTVLGGGRLAIALFKRRTKSSMLSRERLSSSDLILRWVSWTGGGRIALGVGCWAMVAGLLIFIASFWSLDMSRLPKHSSTISILSISKRNLTPWLNAVEMCVSWCTWYEKCKSIYWK